MAQPRGVLIGRKASRTRLGAAPLCERRAAPKLILCVVPRKMPSNPLTVLLKGYELTAANNWTRALRLARQVAYDLYVVYAPLGWADAAEACRKLRAFDARTPLIVYSTRSSAAERREVRSAGAQAYVGRADDAHNLAGTAGQLIMLAELRSMEAMTAGARAMQENIVRRLAKLREARLGEPIALPMRAHERLKLHARRMFALAGGSRANFERMWPSIYEDAVRRLGQSES